VRIKINRIAFDPMTHDGPEHDSVEEAAERLISLAEAAEVCGLSAGYLRQLVRSRLIWGKKIGRNWVTTEEAVREYLAQDRRPGPKPKEG
jgi:excisionase family DNA binding protein